MTLCAVTTYITETTNITATAMVGVDWAGGGGGGDSCDGAGAGCGDGLDVNGGGCDALVVLNVVVTFDGGCDDGGGGGVMVVLCRRKLHDIDTVHQTIAFNASTIDISTARGVTPSNTRHESIT
ncbi:hypothetical protein DPMN_083872 [Dreissena polymorpha]|uniref:Uncharacterized protein n=1 Tax=Dreissena polymorpha TaxID=45954 RepID=A0A9D3YDJ4_DREPO|nr:hypothetical protein DPMN_083872 [Dreissena polymorpha]